MVQLNLQPTPDQADALTRTLVHANKACNCISRTAWENRTFRQVALHRLTYEDIRATFALSAQLTVRCIAKVADSYKIDKKVCRTFTPLGAIAYDDRILSFNRKASSVSIWTLNGRQTIPFVCGKRQRALLQSQRGETDLAYVRSAWYVFAVYDVETPEPIDVEGVVGIDLGVTNIAQGKALKNRRYHHRSLRNKLQKKGTKGSRRRLRKLAGQERRFAPWVKGRSEG